MTAEKQQFLVAFREVLMTKMHRMNPRNVRKLFFRGLKILIDFLSISSLIVYFFL